MRRRRCRPRRARPLPQRAVALSEPDARPPPAAWRPLDRRRHRRSNSAPRGRRSAAPAEMPAGFDHLQRGTGWPQVKRIAGDAGRAADRNAGRAGWPQAIRPGGFAVRSPARSAILPVPIHRAGAPARRAGLSRSPRFPGARRSMRSPRRFRQSHARVEQRCVEIGDALNRQLVAAFGCSVALARRICPPAIVISASPLRTASRPLSMAALTTGASLGMSVAPL